MDKAMDRIEAALARIEAAADRSRTGIQSDRDSYRQLADRVRGTLGELDQLIDELER